MLGHCHDFAVS